MNYLQLVNDFMIETDMDDQIVTVTGQIDDGLKATIWIRDAWLQIQRNEKWEWLWYEGTLTTVASQSTYVYTDITTDDLDRSSLRLPAESKYIHEYGIEAIRFDTATGSPSKVAYLPNRSLVFSPIPDAVYTITADCYSKPVTLTLDTDVPALDTQFHKAIVWLAISNYAREQGAEWAGLYVTANREYNQIYSTMTNRYMPRMEPKVGLTN
mgnify:FL=1|jgi:hypothetical protein|tara:strand:+ start:9765 stop:10397 length:633 start_codon:yes stop_codon:yes gene_type:complete